MNESTLSALEDLLGALANFVCEMPQVNSSDPMLKAIAVLQHALTNERDSDDDH